MNDIVTIIGGGLAGCEAALAVARSGIAVRLYEMKPVLYSPAHKMPHLAELVCSNSLGSVSESSASGLLKEELKSLGSIVIEAAYKTRVPAGQALAVDRDLFAKYITGAIEENENIELAREEIKKLPENGIVVLATGPLTSDSLAAEIGKKIGADSLYFYDAISPIVTAESIDWNIAWKASRYDKGGDDYVNLPLDENTYMKFIGELMKADCAPFREFEKARLFEGCMPIEEIASRGPLTLAHGPMKPVGLVDPRTGRIPFAAVQLRAENAETTLFNIVGFQTKLKRGEQERIFRMIPGLENAEFARFGSLHRNTYLNAPDCLLKTQEFKFDARIIAAGQIVGVEGYLESAASGILAGLRAVSKIRGTKFEIPPAGTVIGALLDRIETQAARGYQPMNANYGILPAPPRSVYKKDRKKWFREKSLEEMKKWISEFAA